jgi:glucokinase
MVTLGTGVGGGVVIDSRILNGISGCAGEIGHIPCVAEEDITENCSCGGRGCLEQVASATGIVNYARLYLSKYDTPSVLRDLLEKQGSFTAKDVLDAGKAGDRAAEAVIEKITYYLGRALAGICAVVNPDCVLIGGGVSAAGEYLRGKVEKQFKAQAFSGLKDTPVRLATLGNAAGIAGAAYMIISERK